MKFELSNDDLAKIAAWSKEQDAKTLEKQKNSDDEFIRQLAEDGMAYYGAIGGELTYSFTPTSLGVVVTVEHSNGEKLNLTDYDSW